MWLSYTHTGILPRCHGIRALSSDSSPVIMGGDLSSVQWHWVATNRTSVTYLLLEFQSPRPTLGQHGIHTRFIFAQIRTTVDNTIWNWSNNFDTCHSYPHQLQFEERLVFLRQLTRVFLWSLISPCYFRLVSAFIVPWFSNLCLQRSVPWAKTVSCSLAIWIGPLINSKSARDSTSF